MPTSYRYTRCVGKTSLHLQTLYAFCPLDSTRKGESGGLRETIMTGYKEQAIEKYNKSNKEMVKMPRFYFRPEDVRKDEGEILTSLERSRLEQENPFR